MRNQRYDTFFADFDFGAIFCEKMGVGTTRAPTGLGPQKHNQKFAPLSGTFGSIIISKSVFENSRPEPPPPPLSAIKERWIEGLLLFYLS